ncbi:PREDICTED: uncharacterized protein LOC105450025 isoform X2 [Wasmannia auropunctata]|uniref:uncharacterized protein LOC105450025 isoform X2 n=1 Tax=Wasmannia auropunctata TaxID=64793 RepID=UPI0005EF00DC|nr:PREDICTED: uncharacterized protein LOC105450025 isoform X2 [Wasmannia auropunctata]
MKVFVIIFAAFAIGAQCRSLSNTKDIEKESAAYVEAHRSARVHRDTSKQDAPNWIESIVSRNSLNSTGERIPVNTLEQLKELIASYEDNFGKLVNFAIKMSKNKDNNEREIQFLKQLSSLVEQLVQEQSKALSNNPMVNVNNVKDLIDTMKEIDIVYQDGEITDEHIRIKRAVDGYKRAASLEERMTNMLIDIQRQVVQIRKYLDKLCKKHPTSMSILEVNPDDDIFPVGQTNKVEIM